MELPWVCLDSRFHDVLFISISQVYKNIHRRLHLEFSYVRAPCSAPLLKNPGPQENLQIQPTHDHTGDWSSYKVKWFWINALSIKELSANGWGCKHSQKLGQGGINNLLFCRFCDEARMINVYKCMLRMFANLIQPENPEGKGFSCDSTTGATIWSDISWHHITIRTAATFQTFKTCTTYL